MAWYFLIIGIVQLAIAWLAYRNKENIVAVNVIVLAVLMLSSVVVGLLVEVGTTTG